MPRDEHAPSGRRRRQPIAAGPVSGADQDDRVPYEDIPELLYPVSGTILLTHSIFGQHVLLLSAENLVSLDI